MTPWEKSFSISEIRKKISGVSYYSKFYFKFIDIDNINDILNSETLKTKLNDIFFYSENISIPSRGLTTEVYTYSNGFRFEVPTGTNYGDGNINVSMMVDEKFELYDFFIRWMDKIQSKQSGYLKFHNKYVTDIKIIQIPHTSEGVKDIKQFVDYVDIDSNNFFGIELINCYPKAVGDIPFKHDNKEMIKFNVNFSFEKINYNSKYLNS